MRQFKTILLNLVVYLGLLTAAVAAPPVVIVDLNNVPLSTSFPLLTNASASGSSYQISGSDYLFNVTGTFGGATVTLTATSPTGSQTLGTYTAAPASPVCFAVSAGTTVQATVAGGAPSGLNAVLSSVGPGGCGPIGSSVTITAAIPAGQSSIGNVGGLTKTVCVTPTVTNGTYGANVVVGGLLTFANLFTSTGHGVIQTAALNFTTAQTVGFKLYPFRGSPTNASTWTDHSAAAISGATDIFLTDQPIQLANPDSGLSATMTDYGAIGLGQAYNPANTSGFFVLVPTATTASLGGTANVAQVCVTVLQDS